MYNGGHCGGYCCAVAVLTSVVQQSGVQLSDGVYTPIVIPIIIIPILLYYINYTP